MRKVLALATNDLRLTLRDRASFFWLLVLPIGLMGFFGMFGGAAATPRRVSRWWTRITAGWRALSSAQITGQQIEVVKAKPGERKVRTLVIPKGFTEGVLAGKQQTLAIEKDEDADAIFPWRPRPRCCARSRRPWPASSEMKESGRGLRRPLAARPAARQALRPTGRARAAGSHRPCSERSRHPHHDRADDDGDLRRRVPRHWRRARECCAASSRAPCRAPTCSRGSSLGRVAIAAVQIVLLLVVAGRFVFKVSFGHSPLGLALLLLWPTPSAWPAWPRCWARS